jgi:murein DD-endopeptidase MepM/ murein hydrolase activator NlpD
MKTRLKWVTDSWAISVNGKSVIYLATQEEAKEALNAVKNYYLPKNNSITVSSIGFKEKIGVVPAQGVQENLSTKEQAVQLMVKGFDKIVQHTVAEGDSLWSIARNNDITVAELKNLNPDLKGELLKPGTALNLKKAEPLLTVVANYTTKVEEKTKYQTEYEKDSSLWKGVQKVKHQGSYGAKEVVYQVTRVNDADIVKIAKSERILKEPEKQVVASGTKVIVASRSGGNGRMVWPTRGTISSPYGDKRGSSRHTGMDIAISIGTPVFAADDGTVILAGRKGSYGNCVEIEHGNGLVTRYGHLSKINVSVGDKVSRGETVIGRVGSTGNSTGPHLHFEVMKGGSFENPRDFLK